MPRHGHRASQVWQPTHRFDTLQIPPHHAITLQPRFPDFPAKLGPSRTRHIVRPGHTRLCRRRGGPVRHDAMPHRMPTAERAAAATGTALRTGRVRMAARLAPSAPSVRPRRALPPTRQRLVLRGKIQYFSHTSPALCRFKNIGYICAPLRFTIPVPPATNRYRGSS